jgi:hypothetical protein
VYCVYCVYNSLKKRFLILNKKRLKEFAFELSEELNISQRAGYERARRACQNYQVECKQIGKTWLIDTKSISDYINGIKKDD